MTIIRTMARDEWAAVSTLIFDSTNKWYMEHYSHPIFDCDASDVELFCQVYEALDPDCCLLAEVDSKIAAACFYHPRETHDSLGIMVVDPNYYGQSLGKQLLNTIIDRAVAANKPLRLISSAMNLDSFSLYNKAGFQVRSFYQDMIVNVPGQGIQLDPVFDQYIRQANIDDIPDIVELEMRIHGLNKQKDYHYYLDDKSGIWELLVYDDGDIRGALVSIKHPASNIVGHGIMNDADIAAALIYRSLNRFTLMTPLIIIPANNKILSGKMYEIKARNCETHILQVYNSESIEKENGIVIPSFMPENG
jgi:GNAT superfamily N-acetyltransferase